MKTSLFYTQKELSLTEIRALMLPDPCPLIPSVPQESKDEDDTWFGARNTDAAKCKFNEETGQSL